MVINLLSVIIQIVGCGVAAVAAVTAAVVVLYVKYLVTWVLLPEIFYTLVLYRTLRSKCRPMYLSFTHL